MEEHKCNDCGKIFDSSDALKQHREAKHSLTTEKTHDTKKSVDKTKIALYGLIILIGAAAVYVIISSLSSGPRIGSVGSTHEHVDFKTYIEGKAIDFSQPRYQVAAQYVHVEGGVGTLIHKHATGVTFGDFLKTVNMDIDDKCFKSDNGKKYCSDENRNLKFYLNGKKTDLYGKYELHDLDKVLISYGNETEDQIRQQLASITDFAKSESASGELPSHLR